MDPLPALRDFVTRELLDGIAPESLDPDANLLADGRLDSLGVVRLVAFLEQHRQPLRIPPEDVTLENFHSLRAIVEYLARRTEGP